MMRSTGGPSAFNVGGRHQTRYANPSQQQLLGERPQTRQRSDERPHGVGERPVTQGKSRREI